MLVRATLLILCLCFFNLALLKSAQHMSNMEMSTLRRVLPPHIVPEFEDHYLIYRAGYNRLSLQALGFHRCRWPVRPKCHFLEHYVLDTSPMNGRFLHNFVSEDFVRRTKSLAVGAHPAHLSKHVVLKYVLQSCLTWRRELVG